MCDCNLSSTFLNRVSNSCLKFDRPFIVACVSERKALRTLQVQRPQYPDFAFFLLCMNQEEGIAMGCIPKNESDKSEIQSICRKLSAENVIITLAEKGFMALESGGSIKTYPAPSVSKLVSVTGGGDALLSAVVLNTDQNKQINWLDLERTIGRIVGEVLGRKGATVGSRTRPDELKVVPKAEMERLQSLERDHLIKAFNYPIKIFGKRLPVGEFIAFSTMLIAGLTFAYQIYADKQKRVLNAPPQQEEILLEQERQQGKTSSEKSPLKPTEVEIEKAKEKGLDEGGPENTVKETPEPD